MSSPPPRLSAADQVARPRRELAVDGRVAERRERDDEAVELAAPVVHAVERGVRDQHVAAGAAEGEVAVAEARVGVLRVVVLAAVGEQVVVELQVVVAEAAEQPVAVRAADEPVVAEVAVEPVAAVVRLHELAVRVDRLAGRLVDDVRVEVEEPVRDDRPRVVGVVGRELRRRRVVVRAGSCRRPGARCRTRASASAPEIASSPDPPWMKSSPRPP